MGYRSDVRIATTLEGYKRICRFVDKASAEKDVPQLIGTDTKPDYFEEHDGCVVFGWDWIKWYDDWYADVINVVRALERLVDDGVPYEFCRIGENWDDVEFENHDDDAKLTIRIEPTSDIGIYF